MLAYAVRRILGGIPTLLIIITLAFSMIRAAPGGPFDQERQLPPEIEANLLKAYHLDEPLYQQYGRYLLNLLQGDFGPSFKYKDHTVTELLWQGFPVSAQIGLSAILIAFFVGTTLGSVAALRQNTATDYTVMTVAMFGIAVPVFVVAPFLSLIFGVYLGWLPVATWNDGALRHMVLPVAALSLPYIAIISRLTRGSMIEVLHSNFIRTAHAKGLSEHAIIVRHALKGALMPVVTFMGPATAGIITGSVVIEQIFSLPGIGRYFVQGALNRDYTLVMGTVVFIGILLILANLIVDLIYGWLDPKVRYD